MVLMKLSYELVFVEVGRSSSADVDVETVVELDAVFEERDDPVVEVVVGDSRLELIDTVIALVVS